MSRKALSRTMVVTAVAAILLVVGVIGLSASGTARASTSQATTQMTGPAVTTGPLNWSSSVNPSRIRNIDFHLAAVSCASHQFCAAVSQDGVFTSTDPQRGPRSWSARLLPHVVGYGYDISCPSSHLCVISDQSGDLYTSTDPAGSSPDWTQINLVPYFAATSVVCLADNWCIDGDDDGGYYTSTDPQGGKSAWHHIKSTGLKKNGINNLSCSSEHFCWTTIKRGDTWVTTTPLTGGWHKATKPVTASPTNRKISCPGSGLCVQVTNTPNPGEILTAKTDKGPWSGGRLNDWTDAEGAACPTEGQCIVFDDQADALGLTALAGGGLAWSDAQVPGQHTGGAVACITAKLCLAGGDHGELLISRDPEGRARTWHAIKVPALKGSLVDEISCASARLCVVGSGNGKLLVSTDPTGPGSSWHERAHMHIWGEQDQPPSSTAITFLSCPDAHLCYAGYPEWDTRGPWVSGEMLVTTSPNKSGSWHALYKWLSGVSCPGKHLCVASDSSSKAQVAYTTKPGSHASNSWKFLKISGFKASSPEDEPQIACLNTHFCVVVGVVDRDKGALAYSSNPTDASSWKVQEISSTYLTGIWCGKDDQCITGDDNGTVYYAAPSR